MKKHLAILMILFIGLTSIALGKTVMLTGSSTIAPLALEIAKRLEKNQPGIKIDVQTGGSSRGIKDVREGSSDIGMVSRDLNDDEKNLKAFAIAKDGISIILHSANPVKELSENQIVRIYKGEVRNWKELGGLDAPITVINKAEGRSTLELFCHFFKIKNSDIKAHVVIGDNAQGIKTVSGNPHAIGYVSIGSAEAAIAERTPLKLLPMNGIPANVQNIRNGTFPISRVLNLVTKNDPIGVAKDYIQLAMSKKVNDLIEDQFFVPIK